jgi:signal peptidase I
MEIIINEKKIQQNRKSGMREWLESVLFAVTAATLIRWLFFSAFVIPTPSMENSLLVGDYLFVSRLHYGTTTPVTPLQVPLAHQTIWGTNIPSYVGWIKLPSYRLPGISEVKKGDVVVFNLPVEHPDLYKKFGNVLSGLKPHPADLRTNYIKRCVATPGDTMRVVDGRVFINGTQQEVPLRVQNEYFVSTGGPVNELNIFKKNGVVDYAQFSETFNDSIASNDESGYIIKATSAIVDKLKTYDFVKRIEPVLMPADLKESFLFPASDQIAWNKDQYGPVVIPKKGATISLTPENMALYADVIMSYEGNGDLKLKDGQLFSQTRRLDTYTFKQDYYFMMGDNRHNSADSRYWGFVPKDHIVGKAVFVWMSIDPNPVDFIHRIRWDRIFRVIR